MAQLKDSIVQGNLRVTDTTLTDTLQVTTIKAPTSSGGSTYGPGSSGQVLKSNGSDVYWSSDTDTDNKVLQSETTTTNFRPFVLGKHDSTNIAELTNTETDQVYTTARFFMQPSSGDVILYTPYNWDSPALMFRRGTLDDSHLDWKIYNTSGTLTFSQTPQDSTGWVPVVIHKTESTTVSTIKSLVGIYGQTYGNNASELISGTAGVISYGDGGPQIDFGISQSATQRGALIFTDHDTAATGASFHFVSTESDWNVISKRFHAKTNISVGTSLPNTSSTLYVSGTGNITGNTTIGGNLGVTGNVSAAKYSTNATAQGYYLKDSSGAEYAGIYDNGTNLWIGAYQTNATHHVGKTYISSGYDSSTSLGNSSIYVSVPNATNTNATNYEVLHSGNTSFTQTLSSGTKIGTIKINGTSTDLYCQTNTNTDTKVTQSSSTTTNYRPLVLGAKNSTTISELSQTVTDQTYTTTNMYAQPSTGTIFASGFNGVIYKAGGQWITARDNAPVYANKSASTGGSYYPALFAKSKTGGWSLGVLGNSDILYVTYTTDANYTADPKVNENTYQITFPTKSGTIALTSDVSEYLPLTGGTIANSGFAPLSIKRTNTNHAAIKFENSNGVLGYLEIGTVDGPFKRVDSSATTSNTWDIIDRSVVTPTPSAKTHSDWSTTSERTVLITKGWMSYWNGAYNSSGNSNLTYCTQGAFGSIVTKSTTDYSKVSVSQSLSSGTKIGTITIDGTATDLYCQTNTNTDTKVTQSISSDTSGKTYPLIFSYYEVGSTTTTAQTVLRKDSIYARPNDGVLFANGFNLRATNQKITAVDKTTGENGRYTMIGDNGSNLWIGAQDSVSYSHRGSVYISTGWDATDGLPSSGTLTGKSTIFISVPTYTAGASSPWTSTSYSVLHTGNLTAGDSNGQIKIAGTNTTIYSHPTYTSKTSGLYKITVNTTGHVSATADMAAADVSSLINLLTTGDSNAQLADYYVSQYAGGGTTTTTYHRRPISKIWNTFRSLITIATTGSGNAITSASIANDGDNRKITFTKGSTFALASDIPSYGTVGSVDRPVYFSSGTPTQVNIPESGKWFQGIPFVSSGGVLDIGKYIDFHTTATSTADHDIRMSAETYGLCVDSNFALTSSSGDSPALIFKRGTFTDNLNDWKIYNSGGHLYFAISTANASTETWTNKMYINGSNGKLYVGSTAVSLEGHTHSNYLGGVKVGSYYGMAEPDGTDTNWTRCSKLGLIPYAANSDNTNGNVTDLGTSTWTFRSGFINNLYYKDLKCVDVTASTIDTITGSFIFKGNSLIGNVYDWVGIAVNSDADRWQITAENGHMLFRQNDSSEWTNWKQLMFPDDVSGSSGITVTKNTRTIGTGDDAFTYNSSLTISHSNSITAVTTAAFKKFKYDANGHITGVADVAASDLPSHTHSYAGSSSAGGAATNVNITNLAGSAAAATYRLTFVSSNGSQALTTDSNNGPRFLHRPGTTSTVGIGQIILGNDTASDTADNAKGALILYSQNTGYARFEYASSTANSTFLLPAKTAGTYTLATTADLGSYVLKSGDTMSGNLTVSKSSGDTGFYATRSDTSVSVWMGVGSGGENHGVFSQKLSTWLINGTNTACYVYHTLQNPTSEGQYAISFGGNNTAAGTKPRYVNDGLKYVTIEGTASNQGYSVICVGNTTPSGTAGNKTGYLRAYGTTAYYAQLSPGALTANRTITIPNATGTMALTSSNITGKSAGWTTARTLTLDGHATGSASIDGTADKTLTVSPKNSLSIDNTSDYASYAWHKFAEITVTGAYEDQTITFLASPMYTGTTATMLGILTAHVRTTGTKVHDSVTLRWNLSSDDVVPDNFVLVYTDTADTSTKVELWYKNTGQYNGYSFVVLREHVRSEVYNHDRNKWTLFSSSGHGSASYPSGTGNIKSTRNPLASGSLFDVVGNTTRGGTIRLYDNENKGSTINYYTSTKSSTIFRFIPYDVNGVGVFLNDGGGGCLVAGAGESPSNIRNTFFSSSNPYGTAWTYGNENTVLSADSALYFISGANSLSSSNHTDWTHLRTAIFDANGAFRPSITNKGSIGTNDYKWSAVYATTLYGNITATGLNSGIYALSETTDPSAFNGAETLITSLPNASGTSTPNYQRITLDNFVQALSKRMEPVLYDNTTNPTSSAPITLPNSTIPKYCKVFIVHGTSVSTGCTNIIDIDLNKSRNGGFIGEGAPGQYGTRLDIRWVYIAITAGTSSNSYTIGASLSPLLRLDSGTTPSDISGVNVYITKVIAVY